MSMLIGRNDLDKVTYNLVNQLQYNGALPSYVELSQADRDYFSAQVQAAVGHEPLQEQTPEGSRFDTGVEDNELIKTIVQSLNVGQ